MSEPFGEPCRYEAYTLFGPLTHPAQRMQRIAIAPSDSDERRGNDGLFRRPGTHS